VTKTIGDNYRIYSLIIILNAGIVASVGCGLFKMSICETPTRVFTLGHNQYTSLHGHMVAIKGIVDLF